MSYSSLFSQSRFFAGMLILVTALWILLWLTVLPWPAYGWLIVLVSYFVADAGSYILHYLVDFYGDPHKPGIVHEFQQHHDNQFGIVNASLSEVLLPAAWIVVPGLLLLSVLATAGWLHPALYLALSVAGLCWGYAQLFHRWAHQAVCSWPVRFLQDTGMILSSWSHAEHHIEPYTSHYAVVNGWSNPLFDRFGMPGMIDRVMLRLGFAKRCPV